MKQQLRLLMTALLCAVFGTAGAVEVTDVLNNATTGVTGTKYAEWTAQVNTAVYAGQSAGDHESIQMRSNNNNSGIVSTTSGGTVRKVTVTWNSNTTGGRTLSVYGSNTAYTAPTDLYSSNSGDLLGEIVCGTSTELEIDGNYTYIGLRSKNGAMYLDDISIVWETDATPTPTAPNAPKFSPEGGTYYAALNVTLTTTSAGANIYYTLDGSTPTVASTAYSEPIEITETTTIKAIAVRNDLTSEVAEATYTIEDATLANIAALSGMTQAGEYDVKFENAVVTYVNGSYAYIQDASGAIAMYKSDHGLTAGQVLNGTATVTFQLRNNNPQITTLDGVTATDGTAPEPTTVAAAAWNTPIATVLSQYFKVTGATITKSGNYFYTKLGDENVQLYGRGEANPVVASDLNVTYTIIGFPTLYNNTIELYIFVQPEAEGATKEAAELSYSESTFTATIGEENAFPTLDNPNGLDITYKSSHEDVATIAADGTITLVAPGQTTIIATSEESDNFLAGEAKYTLVVKEKAIVGTIAFELVDDAASLAAGDEIIIVNADNDYAISTTQKENNRAAEAVAPEDDGTIIPSNLVQVITLEGSAGKWNFNTGSGYLYAASNGNNHLKTEASIDADGNANAAITIDAEGVATITFQGTNARNTMRYNPNSGNPIFSCYASTSSTGTLTRIYRSTVSAKPAAGLAYSATEFTANYGQENAFPTLDNPNGLDVTYTSSNEAVATIDTEGKVTLVGEGSTVISATSEENNDYKAGSASYTLTVVVPLADNDDKFELVSDLTTLAAGDEIILVGKNDITEGEGDAAVTTTSYYGLGTNQKANNREGIAVTYNEDGTITGNTKLQTITLEGEAGDWYFNVGSGYLYAASSDKNYLRTEAEADANASAIISTTENGLTIVFQGDNTRNELRFNYNNGTPLFSCYANSSTTGTAVNIYRKAANTLIMGDANGDGTVTVADVLLCVDYSIKGSADNFHFANADTNGDGVVGVADIMAIVSIVMGN